MANIKVNDIKPAGAELFADSESFMNELSQDETNNVLGGNVLRANGKVQLPSQALCSTVSLAACGNGVLKAR